MQTATTHNGALCKIRDVSNIETELKELFAKYNCTCNDIGKANNMTIFNCIVEMPHALVMTFLCVFGLVATVSLIANGIVIWIIIWHPVMRQRTTNWQVLNLAFSDMCLTVFNTIPLGIVNVIERWPWSNWSCKPQQMLGVITVCASVFTLVLISVDRYYAILYPLSQRQWVGRGGGIVKINNGRRFTMFCICLIWALSVMYALPELWIYESYDNVHVIGLNEKGQHVWRGMNTFCQPRKEWKDSNQSYNHVLFIFQFLLPLLVLVFAYTRIGVELYQANCSLDDINRTARDSHLCAKRRTARLFAIMVFCFFGLWTPYQILFTLSLECLAKTEWAMCVKVLGNLAFLLAMCSTLISPAIYYNMSERFYTGFCYALRWVPCWHGGDITKAHYEEVFALNGTQRQLALCYSPTKQRRSTANSSELGW